MQLVLEDGAGVEKKAEDSNSFLISLFCKCSMWSQVFFLNQLKIKSFEKTGAKKGGAKDVY